MLKHWEPLTLFLREPGAPLDNNACERALKRAVLHRKNSLFYRTRAGAEVGDAFMSVIHTCELNDVNPFGYLVAVLKHPVQVEDSPEDSKHSVGAGSQIRADVISTGGMRC